MDAIKNAKIKYSFLGIDEGNIPIFYLGFEYKEGQEWKNVSTNKVVFIDTSFVRDLLVTLEVRSWEELPRKFARIKIRDGKVVSIGNLLEEKWIEVK